MKSLNILMNNTCDICNILNIFVKRYWTSLVMALYKWSIIIIIILSTVVSPIGPWIPCSPINVLEGGRGGEEENPVQQDKQKVPASSYLTPSPR